MRNPTPDLAVFDPPVPIYSTLAVPSSDGIRGLIVVGFPFLGTYAELGQTAHQRHLGS